MPIRRISWSLLLVVLALAVAAALIRPATGLNDPASPLELFEWERGIAVRSREDPSVEMYLWFYEWNLFGAMEPGLQTLGTFALPRTIGDGGATARIESPELTLEMTAAGDAVDLLLTVENRTDRAWQKLATIIPCFTPGFNPDSPLEPERSRRFVSENSYFLSGDDLLRLEGQELHFNHVLRDDIDARAANGPFPFSEKWPTAEPDATSGVLIRESTDGKFVTAIVWEEFATVQANNLWKCLHVGVRVGPLEPGAAKRIRGRIYLFPGTKEECLKRIRRDFYSARAGQPSSA